MEENLPNPPMLVAPAAPMFISPKLYSWGRADFGNLFCKSRSDNVDGIFTFSSTRTVIGISSNTYHSAAVTSTGELYTCGENDEGQVSSDLSEEENNIENRKPRIFELLGGQQRITSVSCGLTHTVCITSSGAAVSFGGNESGQLGHSPGVISKVAPKIVRFNYAGNASAHVVAKKAVCGDLFTLFLMMSGEIFGCGSASFLGNALNSDVPDICNTAQRVEGLLGTQIVEIAAGSHHSVALTRSGELYSWGRNKYAELGYECEHRAKSSGVSTLLTAAELNTENLHQQTPKRVQLGQLSDRLVGLSAGFHHTVVWSETGKLFGTGNNKYGQLALDCPQTSGFLAIELTHAVTMAACGSNHTLVLCQGNGNANEDSSPLFGFGANSNGQVMGASSAPLFRVPQLLTTLPRSLGTQHLLRIAAGGDQSFAIGLSDADLPGSSIAAGANLLRKQFSTLASHCVTPLNAPAIKCLIQEAWPVAPSSPSQPTSPLHLTATRNTDQRGQAEALASIFELFSSPSLLSSSFECSPTSKQALEQAELLKEWKENYTWDEIQKKNAAKLPYLKCLPTTAEHMKRAYASILSTEEGKFMLESADAPAEKLLSAPPLLDIEGIEACYVALMQAGGASGHAKLLAAIQQCVADLEHAAAALHVTSTSSGSSSSSTSRTTKSTFPDSVMRVIAIIWQCPLLSSPSASNQLLLRLLKLAEPQFEKLKLIFAMYPKHLLASRILNPLQAHLSHKVTVSATGVAKDAAGDIQLLCDAILVVWRVNSRRNKILEPELFYNDSIETIPDQVIVGDYLNNFKVTTEANEKKKRKEQSSTTEGASRRSNTEESGSNSSAASSAMGSPTADTDTSSSESEEKPPFHLTRYAFLLSTKVKRRILLGVAEILQSQARNAALHFAVLTGSVHNMIPYFILHVNRQHLLQETLIQLASTDPQELRKPLRVIFAGEEGIDEGGVKKEFFQLLMGQLLSPDYAMFTTAPSGRATIINQANNWSEQEYELVGTLLALAIYNGVLLDVHFPLVMYKQLIGGGANVSSLDLLPIDPDLHKGLKQLLEHEPASEVEAIACRNFVVEWEEFGGKMEKELVPDGKNIPVTGENRYQYADLLIKWILSDSIQPQLTALLRGFHRVLPPFAMMIFAPEEMQLLAVGKQHLDFHELEASTDYIGNETWNKDNVVVQTFWRIVHGMTLEEKQKFLFFVTGSSKAPIGGLRDVQMKLQRMGPHSISLPTAHTCFNTLLLPEYNVPNNDAGGDDETPSSEAMDVTNNETGNKKLEIFMKDRLLTAIKECEGFGLK